MYSGLVLTRHSGRFLGVHQKIDRAAHHALAKSSGVKHFPRLSQILDFEGRNGPDGIKIKSPSVDELWHFVDPFDPDDTGLLEIIDEHMANLVMELKRGNDVRAAFEASWLAHAITDGLTPAHHYPYKTEIERMRAGQGIHTRDTVIGKFTVKGENSKQTILHSWQMYGFKGLMVSHSAFEAGVVAIAAPMFFRNVRLSKAHLRRVHELGFNEYYEQKLREVALWHMFDDFTKFGWTLSLSKKTRDELLPLIIEVVATAWYVALKQAGLASKVRK